MRQVRTRRQRSKSFSGLGREERIAMDEFIPSGRFVLRAPVLPFDRLVQWSSSAPGDGYEIARDNLNAAISDPQVSEAIRLASPYLFDRLDEWRRDPDSRAGQRVEYSLARYFSRMCSRSTPFGLFSGVTTGVLGESTCLELDDRSRHRRYGRIDNQALFQLVERARNDDLLREGLSWYPNQSIYRIGPHLRWYQNRVKEGRRTQHLVQIEATEAVDRTLEICSAGACLGSLADALVADDPDIPVADARAFVEELAAIQLLQCDLEFQVTGDEPAVSALNRLRDQGAEEYERHLVEALEAVRSFGCGVQTEGKYASVVSAIHALAPDAEASQSIQMDLVLEAPHLTLGKQVEEAIRSGNEVVRRVSRPQDRSALEAFRKAFVKRWEGRTVPLAEALDEELGIGYGSSSNPGAAGAPLLAGMRLSPPAAASPQDWLPRDRYLLRRIHELVRHGEGVLELDEVDLERLETTDEVLPDAFSSMVTLVADGSRAIDEGDFEILFHGVVGPSGGRLLGRFCHASKNIHEMVALHLRREEELLPEAIFAEVVHLNDGREGNLVCRPVLRPHEILVSGVAGAGPEDLIPVADLLVSVRAGSIILTSRSRGRRVIPRLTSALNVDMRSPAVYRFLVDLQMQDGGGFVWSWGPLSGAPFLPRVQYGKIILSRALWTLGREDLEPFAVSKQPPKSASSPEAIEAVQRRTLDAVEALRERLGLPRWIALAEFDQELMVDLDNPLSALNLAWMLSRRDSATLVEGYPAPGKLPLRGPSGRHCHQLILCWTRADSVVSAPVDDRTNKAEEQTNGIVPPSNGRSATRRIRSVFGPGSSWLYAKIYTGQAMADDVLRDAVVPVCVECLQHGSIKQWHFLRYRDPDHHLRVRFHGEPAALLDLVLPTLHRSIEPMIDQGMAWRFELGTYEREVERYGGSQAIELAECLFWHDSAAVVEALALVRGDEDAEARWKLAIAGADLLLRDLGFDLDQREALIVEARDGMQQEFETDVELFQKIGDRYREHRKEIESLLAGRSTDKVLAAGLEAFAKRSARQRESIGRFQELRKEGLLVVNFPSIAWSLVHMHINRILHANQRAQELVLYDFMRRAYSSQRFKRSLDGD